MMKSSTGFYTRCSKHSLVEITKQFLIALKAQAGKTEKKEFIQPNLILTIPIEEKLLVRKEKATAFLGWLENR